MPPKKDKPDKLEKKSLEPVPSTSHTPVSKTRSHNPVVRYDSLSIEEMSEDISSQLDKLINEGKSFEDIFLFYLSKKPFSLEQTSKWLQKFNKFRKERATSNFPKEFGTDEPSGAIRQTVAGEAIENFINRLCKKHDWSLESNKKSESLQEGHETSSDYSSEDEEPKQSLPSPPSHSALSRRLSWKDFKKTKQMDEMLSQKPKHPNIKTLIKQTIKELFKQKKKNKKLVKEKRIEVDKEEVVDMIYNVTDYMAKRYIPKIRQIATRMDPALDISGSECESGSYDSEDNFYEHKEDKRSLLPKMAMSVNPELLVKEGLYGILLVTLPLCINYTDSDQLYEFLDILKDTKEQVILEPRKRKGAPGPLDAFKEREGKSSEVKAKTAAVEPSPSNETLAGMADIKEWRRDSTSTQEDALETDILKRLQRRNILKSAGSEDSPTPFMDESTSSDPVFFPDAGKAEARATLASPEDVSDIQMSEPSEADPSPEHSDDSASTGLPRTRSRRRSEYKKPPGIPPAKKNK